MVDAAQNQEAKSCTDKDGRKSAGALWHVGIWAREAELLIVHEMLPDPDLAKIADIVFPAASGWRGADGSVTNTSVAKLQLLHKAAEVMESAERFRSAAHSVLHINLGKTGTRQGVPYQSLPANVSKKKFTKAVPGCDVPAAGLLTGGAEPTHVQVAKNGHAPYGRSPRYGFVPRKIRFSPAARLAASAP